MTPFWLIRALDRGTVLFITLLAAIAVAVPALNLLAPSTSQFYLSTYFVALFGKYICYAILALSIDLIWGYCGILSLGHGAFFALGGYAMGIYLMRQIGPRGGSMRTQSGRTSWCSSTGRSCRSTGTASSTSPMRP